MLQRPSPKTEGQDFRLIEREDQARIITSRVYMGVIWATRQPRAISEIAQFTNASLETTAYRVKRLKNAGLLEVADDASINGRRVRRYRSYPRWTIPDRVMPAASLEEFMTYFLHNGLARTGGAFARHLRVLEQSWTLRLDFEGPLFLEFRPDGDFDWLPVLEGTSFNLRPTDARALHDELRELYQKYAALHDPEIGSPHLLGLMFTRD